jgi:hypothetical protein
MSKIIQVQECPAWCKRRSHNSHNNNIIESVVGGSIHCNKTGYYLYVEGRSNWFTISFKDESCIFSERNIYIKK